MQSNTRITRKLLGHDSGYKKIFVVARQHGVISKPAWKCELYQLEAAGDAKKARCQGMESACNSYLSLIGFLFSYAAVAQITYSMRFTCCEPFRGKPNTLWPHFSDCTCYECTSIYITPKYGLCDYEVKKNDMVYVLLQNFLMPASNFTSFCPRNCFGKVLFIPPLNLVLIPH